MLQKLQKYKGCTERCLPHTSVHWVPLPAPRGLHISSRDNKCIEKQKHMYPLFSLSVKKHK